MIRVQNLTKYYDSFQALSNISLEVQSGEIMGFLGPNGAGKTTTMKILSGYMPASTGIAEVNNLSVTENSIAVRKQIGYLPESNPLYLDFTVEEALNYMCEIHRIQKNDRPKAITKVVKECSLEDVYYKQIDQLSKGYRQRVGLAQALIHEPAVLILDEPTVGLDPKQIIEIRDLIKKIGRNKTVLLSTHIMQEVQALCDRVTIIHQGKVVASGTVAEILHNSEQTLHSMIYVKTSGTIKKAEDILKQISGVKKVNKKDSEGKNIHGYELVLEKDVDIRSDIAQVLLKNDLKLYELTPTKASLEDVFIQLTK